MVYASLADTVRYGHMRVIGIVVIALLAGLPAPLAAQCMLCTPGSALAETRVETPLAVEIGSGLDFDRVSVTAPAGGSVAIDPVSRSRLVQGALSNLGGLVMTGSATVRGEAGRAVRIALPGDVLLRSGKGGEARVTRLVTDLPAAPRLGADGTLRFSFGGQLDVNGDMDGDYRGRIAITVDYQ